MIRKNRNYWTKEKCQEESLKYNTRFEFQKNSKGSYYKSYINNWLDDICKHMIEIKKKSNYWTKEKCQEESLKYKTKSEFQKKSTSAYNSAYINNFLDDICVHMITIGHKYKRCIYSYEFSDNYVYVGLTFNINDRNNRHLRDKRSSVYKHILETNLQPYLRKITEYIDVELASNKEGEILNEYKNNGWNILNKSKTGNLGGVYIKWNYENCKNESLKYSKNSF